MSAERGALPMEVQRCIDELRFVYRCQEASKVSNIWSCPNIKRCSSRCVQVAKGVPKY